jgi:hypothetical protein
MLIQVSGRTYCIQVRRHLYYQTVVIFCFVPDSRHVGVYSDTCFGSTRHMLGQYRSYVTEISFHLPS